MSELQQPVLSDVEERRLITRREAIQRVTMMLGGTSLVGGSALLTGCLDIATRFGAGAADFSAEDIALLDEIAETMLPATSTPGAKAAGVGPFMALMVTDTYDSSEQEIFRDGMRQLERVSREMNGAGFMESTPAQRLALLEWLDREQWNYMDTRRLAQLRRSLADVRDTTATGDAFLPDQRQQNAPGVESSAVPGITADAPPHYFRMMKELALLGYFTSEIGYTQAMRYEETPGRFEPCVPYRPGEKAWAPHA